LRIPQLKDCKNHFDKKKEKGKGTMVFICEGQSAVGSITSCRECWRTATRPSWSGRFHIHIIACLPGLGAYFLHCPNAACADVHQG